jgi:hypothetical protein
MARMKSSWFERRQHRPAHLHIVEGRMQVVHAEGADIAERIADIDVDVGVALEHRHEVGERGLPPVDLAVLERGRAAVAGSGMMTHSIRSTSMFLPPASQSAFSERGT